MAVAQSELPSVTVENLAVMRLVGHAAPDKATLVSFAVRIAISYTGGLGG